MYRWMSRFSVKLRRRRQIRSDPGSQIFRPTLRSFKMENGDVIPLRNFGSGIRCRPRRCRPSSRGGRPGWPWSEPAK